MKFKFKPTLVLLILFLGLNTLIVKGQELQGIKTGIKLPYSYNVGYFAQFSERWAMALGGQIVTYPFNSTYTGLMNLYGAESDKTRILKQSFTFTWGFEGAAYYFFGTDNRRYYASINLQWMSFYKINLADSIINNGLNVDLSSFPEGPIDKTMSVKPLTLAGNFMQIGIVAGKKFFFMEPKFEVHLEFGLSKTIGSHFRLASDYRFISPVNDLLNKELKQMFVRFGWLPTFNVVYIFKLK